MAGVVLAAGAGTRLRPLTLRRPKALCPVDNVPLVDLALRRLTRVCPEVAVNVHHGRDQLEAHLEGRVHLSVEEPEALGTAGALGRLRDWIGGRAALVVNADGWTEAALGPLTEGWDGDRVRLLLSGGGPLEPTSALIGSLLPWRVIEGLSAEPTGLYEYVLAPEDAAGRVECLGDDGPFIDCASPADYLQANLTASGGRSVVDPTAVVEGHVNRCVVWPGASVPVGEVLTDAIRADDHLTVLVR